MITQGGRILALDVGKRRIGMAISDELGIAAHGIETLERTTIRQDLDRIGAIAAERNVAHVLIGYPLQLSGNPGRQAEYTRDFGSRLEQRLGLRVTYWDERLTTAEASRVLRQSGISIEKRARAVDRMAAVILLNSYLDSLGEHN